MKVRVGQHFTSAVDATTVIVVKAPASEIALTCGGPEMIDPRTAGAAKGELDPALTGETKLGKRYVNEAIGLELLCMKGGKGVLAVDGAPLALGPAAPGRSGEIGAAPGVRLAIHSGNPSYSGISG